ncbi:Phenylalanine--tRNA ligase beta subunit [Tepidimonas fonticaldi]|uniref:Phenylalanine--tRNA ligase beta subunit n=1 Tax=Tepidimonas fonticaldi TaxID=1101373 RepID=A0A1A6DUE7_9BURK|nr:phenylalanine--tRNA ligase subunit beta [Tepidimonas fonticaldi]OBS30488.1 phenylalanine--tRNA ligase subunit beta [Tepidimonas fonticaldi]TSE37272.1 Phenylalanine--tRNA ligase beta subunit [Tepidimonas fonticaldi]
MQFPESWLRAFCNPPLDSRALADLLTMAGLEVEEWEPVAPPFTRVVVGEILSAEPHPNADRLRVCRVDAGQGEPLQIVCGAPNARAGIRVPCALVGAVLPPGEDGKPFEIRVGKLRGVESHGMLCSARELGLSDDHGGLLELAADAPVGRDLREALALDDRIFTLKLTPNLAHCLSVYGVAREVAALTGAPLQAPVFAPVAPRHGEVLPVRIDAPDLCGRFTGRIIRGIDPTAKTPDWMVQRLARCGQRSISALVDISNYVMFELGRPSHIFDLDRIHGGLQVRWGRAGETLELLNGQTVTLDETVGVIADDRGVESLAGIMGGQATAVSDATRNVYVEAAFWWPRAIAGRSRRFNFSTDAGHRFERGVDPSTTREHVERITQLILEICGGEVGPIDDHVVNVPQPQPVTLRVARAAKVIGMPLTQAQCAEPLRRLGLEVAEGDGVLTVTPPPYRFDLQIEEDLIEEVARVIGYDRLPDTPPLAPVVPRVRPEAQRSAHAVRRQLADLGYQETINFSFVEERWERDYAGNDAPIRLLNPIASHLSVMRSSLIGSLLAVLKYNTDRKVPRARLFEIGRVFRRDPAVPDSDTTVAGLDQPRRLAGLAWGDESALQWGVPARPLDFYDVKGDVEALLAPRRPVFEPAQHPALHPGRCARVLLDGRPVGIVGELHPRWRQAEGWTQAPVLFELDWDAVVERPVPQAQPLGRHQPVQRDVAVVVREAVTHAELMAAIGAVEQPWLREAVLFDVYRPKAGTAGGALAEGEKSLAVRLTLERHDANLTDEEIDAVVQAVLASLQQRVGARLRA